MGTIEGAQAENGGSEPRYGHWLSIESAPKDGADILCFTKHGDYEVTHWRAVTQCWVSKRGFFVEATHWCPLPQPPHARIPE